MQGDAIIRRQSDEVCSGGLRPKGKVVGIGRDAAVYDLDSQSLENSLDEDFAVFVNVGRRYAAAESGPGDGVRPSARSAKNTSNWRR